MCLRRCAVRKNPMRRASAEVVVEVVGEQRRQRALRLRQALLWLRLALPVDAVVEEVVVVAARRQQQLRLHLLPPRSLLRRRLLSR